MRAGTDIVAFPWAIVVAGLLVLAIGMALALWYQHGALRRVREAHRRAESERDAAIKALSERQGFETLGRLTASIAHDMSNVLQLIVVYLSAMPDAIGDHAALRRIVDNTRRAAERGAAGVRTVLALARAEASNQGDPDDEDAAAQADGARLLTDLADAMRDLLGSGFTVTLDLDTELPPLLATQDDLEAMLVNLATNARDAMAATGSGTLSLSASRVTTPDAADGDLPPGPWVRIAVADTGIGMDAETLAHATEPFFTTKPRSRGTGLGLALVRTFAERCGGLLMIDSAPDAGTRVRLYLRPSPEPSLREVTGADVSHPGGGSSSLPQGQKAGTSRHAAA